MSEIHHSESSMTRFLEKRYAPPHYAFLSQVRNGTGFQRRTVRTADGLAMSLWPSRGIHLNGFEVKVSLSDFKSELAKPEKAEDIAQHCHYWWIVAPSTKIAPLELIPGGWGLLVLDPAGEKLVVAKEAALNPVPVAPDWLMLASILRRANESMVPIETLAEHRRSIEEQVRATAVEDAKRQLSSLGNKAKELIEKEEKLKAVFDDYSYWDVDGFIEKYKLAKRLMTDGRQLMANYKYLLDGAERLKPTFKELEASLKE